ncbi:MAG: PspC domain-containing protein [Sphaerochaetaceae bacterium]
MARTTMDRWYRSPRGKVFGLCTGLAEWRDLNPEAVRWIVFIAVICTGVFPGVIIYLLLSLVIPMNPNPEGYHQHVRDSEEPSDDDLKEKYNNLKSKVEKMESEMFDKEREWDDRFNSEK